jgi:hypothetical protein
MAILPETEWQHITFTMPCQLWPIFEHNRELLGQLSPLAAKTIQKTAKKKGLIVGIFTAIHTNGRDLKWNTHIHLSVTCGGMTLDHSTWKPLYHVKKIIMPMWRYEIINLLRDNFDLLVIPPELQGAGQSDQSWNLFLDHHYNRRWNVDFAKPTKDQHKTVNYLGRYLKRSPLSYSRLKHYDGREVTYTFLNHRTKRQERFTCSADEFIERFIRHIPDHGFRVIRYYGFLANRVRTKLLPKVYALLDLPMKSIPKITYGMLFRQFTGTDPHECILCQSRMLLEGVRPKTALRDLHKHHHALATMGRI